LNQVHKWNKSTIAWSSYSGLITPKIAERYADLILKAVALSAVMDSPIFVFDVTYTIKNVADPVTHKKVPIFTNTFQVSANDTNQVRIYLQGLKITEYKIVKKTPWVEYVKSHYKKEK
jgi:hypothetical protein